MPFSSSLDPAFESAQPLLQGYSLLEWPDLSLTRHPRDHTHTSQHQLSPARFDRVTHILFAVSRVLGAYCGATDVLLAVESAENQPSTFVRVSWKDSDTCGDVIRAIDRQLAQFPDPPIPLSTLRRVLDLGEKQCPCIALCRSYSGPPIGPLEYPLTFTYNSPESQLSLTSSEKYLHPTVSSQILSQVVSSVLHANTQPFASIASINLPSELMSIHERASDEGDLAIAYPHLSPVPVATDYLAYASQTLPCSIAVQWYRELTPETSFYDFESITYIELHQRANQTARWLRRMGLTSGDRVAVSMARNINFHIAMMGIMRAGGCYVPEIPIAPQIDPDLPLERKSYIARDSDARFVFTTADISPSSLSNGRIILFEEKDVQTAIHQEASDDVDFAKPDSIAFLLYTSGTTGNPKGCLLTNKGLSQAIVALSSTAADVRMTDLAQARYLAVASVAFDVHLAESFIPIALGMPLLSAPRSQLLENLPLYVKRLGITHLGIVPSLIEATMGTVQDDGVEDMTLRYIASGGEKISDAILDKWANHPKVRLANFYGPSEATIGCCARYMDSTTPSANIGRPFANVAGYVVDGKLNILPRGGIGELVVEGPLVGRGYHARPDLTEKVFIEWPRKGSRAYRTGDLVRMMPDQTLEILGRIDTQIKLRGVRIELEGVSSIIRKAAPTSSLSSLDATTVIAKHPSIGTEQLVSFVTWSPLVSVLTRKSQKPQVILPPKRLMESIWQVCEAELARYMRPSHIIPLSWLPLSSNGKSDTKLLVEIFNAMEVDTLAHLMPSMHENVSEMRRATKMEEDVLVVLGRHTTMPLSAALPELNIFECGLDSMAVIRFAKDLKDAFGCRISASDIMLTPTLTGICSLFRGASSPSPSGPMPSYTQAFSAKWSEEVKSTYGQSSVERILPPFCVQEGVLSRSTDHDTMYVQHVILACKSGICISGLRRAWRSVMTRHPILRTTFYFSSALVQVVLRADSLHLSWAEDHTGIQDSHEFVRWFLNKQALRVAKNINATISNTPPFRLQAYISPSQSFLVLSIHHALYDGISLPLLVKDAEREYHHSTLQVFADTSDILDYMASTDLVKAKEFWIEHFRGFTWPSKMPLQAASSETIRRTVPFRSSVSSLKELAASQQVTLQAVLTYAFAIAAATRIYQTKDVSFGVIRSGRLLPVDGVENAVCPMVSVVPMRVNLNAQGNALQNIQSLISAVAEVEHVSLGKVQNWVRPGKPLFDSLFSVSIKADISSEIWDVVESQPPEADYLLSVEIVLDPNHDSAVIQAAWKEGSLDRVLVHQLIDDFEVLALDVGSGSLALRLSDVPAAVIQWNAEVTNPSKAEYVCDPSMLLELRHIVCTYLDITERLVTEATSFISLGLDSIKSVGLSRVLKKLGYDVRAADLMKHSSLRMLTNHLASRESTSEDRHRQQAFYAVLARIQGFWQPADLKLSPTDVVNLFPTTGLQAGMLSQTLSSNGALYVHAFPMQLSQGIVLERLQNAWMQAIETYDILRTSFHFQADQGIWVQAVHSFTPSKWTSDTFTTMENYNRKLSIYLASIRLVDENSFHSPPIWLRVFEPSRQSPAKASRLVLVMHHALYDGLSIGRLFDAVQALYNGSKVAPPTQFTSLLEQLVQQEEFGAPFWVELLKGFRPASLPLRDRQETGSPHIASRTFAYDHTRLESVLRRSAVTVQCLGQAVWGKLLNELSGSSDVVFGHTVSGRTVAGAEDVIGPVLNTIPCRVRFHGDLRNIELLQTIHKSNVDALPWQHTSLRSIQRKVGISRLWDSLFLFQPFQATLATEEPLWTFDAQDQQHVEIQYAISVEMHQQKSDFIIKAACRPGYMFAGELEALLERFQHLLENLMLRVDALALDDARQQSNVGHDHQILPPSCPGGLQEPPTDEQIPVSMRSLLASITNIPLNHFTSATPLVALGVDSITAIQIVARLRRAGMKVSANDVVTSRTVGDMVAKIKQSKDSILDEISQDALGISAEEKAAILSLFPSGSVESIIPASAGIKWLIGSWQKSGRTAFHHAFTYRLPPEVDLTKLHGAWASMLQRLVLLRSTFACAMGSREARLVTFKMGSYPYYWTEDRVDDHVLLESVIKKMKELVSSPPSSKLPPTRAAVFQSSAQAYLVIYLHHFQYDAWSLSLILDDLSRLYLGLEPITCSDFLSFLQASAPTRDNLALQKRYWQTAFPPSFVPVLFPSLIPTSSPTYRRTIFTTKTALSLATLCEERARMSQVSLSAVFLASWAHVQGRYSSSNSTTFSLWQAGRAGLFDDIASLAAPCSNIVPVHVSGLHENGVIEIAKGILNDLRDRSAIVVQTDLVCINEWVGAGDKPLCNVVVNIVRIAPDASSEATILEPLELPYYIPSAAPEEPNSTVGRLATTDLVQNDLIIDFAVIPTSNSILMSVDAAAHIMDDKKAMEIVDEWANVVKNALGIS